MKTVAVVWQQPWTFLHHSCRLISFSTRFHAKRQIIFHNQGTLAYPDQGSSLRKNRTYNDVVSVVKYYFTARTVWSGSAIKTGNSEKKTVRIVSV